MNRLLLAGIGTTGLLLFYACGSKPPGPPPPPTSMPPSLPSPSSMPSPPSLPSPPSAPNPGDQPSTPSGPDLSMPKPGSPVGDKGEQQRQAGRDLQEAGAKVAEAAKQLGDSEQDPLVPDSDSTNVSDDMVFADQDTATGQQSADQANDPLDEEIMQAQKALEQAGIAIQTAGVTLETATTDDELAAAEADLATARVAVIVAGQDLADLKDILPDGEADIDQVIAETEDALNDANVAIVVATQTILPGLPELAGTPSDEQGDGIEHRKKGGRTGELDEELEESLVIFDETILDARRVLTDTAPPRSSTTTSSGRVVIPGVEEIEEDMPREESGPDLVQTGVTPSDSEQPENINIATASIPDDIPDPQGDDIVAKQLREIAIAEPDPQLKEKLWEEYRRYKAGI